MINFTPTIKAALFISLIYLIAFQLFLNSGNHGWLYVVNVFYACSLVAYVRFLNVSLGTKSNMLQLTRKGLSFSFISSFISLIGATILYLLNNFFFFFTGVSLGAIKNLKEAIAIVFANSFLVNFVLGSLGAFFTAGLMNEKKYQASTRALSSIKN